MKQTIPLSSRIRAWVGVAMSEAAGRLVILTGTTAMLARSLAPGDFGAAALVLTVVAMFSVCVGTPFEETLAQRRVLRALDLKAALAASLVTALLFLLVAFPLGAGMARVFHRPDVLSLLPVAASQLFAQASLSISTALARRRRRFNLINIASLCGHVAGAGIAIGLAAGGAGIWALIGLRCGIVVANAVALLALLRLWLWPCWSWPRIKAMSRFATYILAARLIENATYLIYNFMVGDMFGLAVLGNVNMALRIVEPLRGAIAAITHNLCFAFFVKTVRDPVQTAEGVVLISSQSALLTAPMFMGVAAIAPVLIPLMAGPGWAGAAPISAMLAAGGMILLPSQIALTALSAMGRPKQGLAATMVGLVTLVVVLLATAGLDPVMVGVARLMADLFQAAAAIILSAWVIPLPQRALLERLAIAWGSAGLMAASVALFGEAARSVLVLGAILPLSVASGCLVYGGILLAFARPSLMGLLRNLGFGRYAAAASRMTTA